MRTIHNKYPMLIAIQQKIHVMKAVMLRDMRTRFFDHGLGFLVVSIWPLAHMVILLAVYTAVGRQVPYGESLQVFFATGLIPTLLFMYVSRFMSLSLILNKPMLSFPVVQLTDIMFARAILEAIAGAVTLFLLFAILLAMGIDPMPYDVTQAVLAYLTTLLLAVGMGTLAGVITMIFPFFVTLYALLMVICYIASGTLFVTSALPDAIAQPLSWNPVVQAVEWMRTAYYETYSDRLLSKSYLVSWGFGSLFLGLLLERVLRQKILEN